MARKKKFKGFKVSDSFVCYKQDDKLFLLSLAQNSLKKCVKSTQTPPEKCVTQNAKSLVDKTTENAKLSNGEYCPKITGCCWDYTKKKGEDSKHVA